MDLPEYTQEQEEAAYRAAEQAIENARETGVTELDLSEHADVELGSQISRPFSALKRLPPEISSLTELRHLSLSGTEVSDLTPLAKLAGLREISVDDSPVSDLEPLSGLSELEELSIDNTRVSDLASLRTLTGLQSLSFDGTQVSNLSPLAALTRLQSLSFDSTEVGDLTPLVAMGDLESLSFNETYVGDLYPITGLQGLERLWLDGTRALNFLPLRSLTGLLHLHMSNTSVSDLSPLAGLTLLHSLGLNDTRIRDLSHLSALSRLTTLSLEGSLVRDLGPIRALTALRQLWLGRSRVRDLSPLSQLMGLEALSINRTEVSDLQPLSAMTELRLLFADRTGVSDLSPLSSLTSLQDLTLSDSFVSDMRPLLHLAKLGTNGEPGLVFTNTPATRSDANLNDLSQIEDEAERAEKTLAYLATLPPWPEPLDPPLEPPQNEQRLQDPEQDPALPLIWGDQGFTFLANRIGSDPVTEAALDDLRTLLEDLRRKGNRHDDLYRLAVEMQERTSRPVKDLSMVRLHLSFQKLRRLYAGREARSEAFDDETVTALGSVIEIVPGVTLADPQVQVLIARQEADRSAVPEPDRMAAEDAVLRAMLDDTAPFDVDVKDTAAAVGQPGQNDRLAATRSVLSRNAVIAVLKNVAMPVATGIVSTFLYEHGAQVLALARTMGDDAWTWAQLVFTSFKAEYEAGIGALRESVTSGAIRRKSRKGPDKT